MVFFYTNNQGKPVLFLEELLNPFILDELVMILLRKRTLDYHYYLLSSI